MTTHSTTPGYFTRYENLAFERTDDGVLTLRFHTNGGPITFTGQTHEDLPQALEEIALDQNNRALLLTGTGDTFMASIDGASLGDIFKPTHWEKIRREGFTVLQRLLDLPMPVIGVANGPATVHSEYLLLADVHIASERATYGDQPHPAFGITGGDGRSEEHTSELQSPCNLVCRLLLEKKKKKTARHSQYTPGSDR